MVTKRHLWALHQFLRATGFFALALIGGVASQAAFPEENITDGKIDAITASIIDESATPLPEQKILALTNIGTRLNDESIRALERYILSPRPESISAEKWYWIVNDIMQALCRQETPAVGFVDALFKIYDDPEQPATLRDYALQHMALLHTPLPGSLTTLDKANSGRILRAILTIAKSGRNQFCATALSGLANIVTAQNYLRAQIADPFIPNMISTTQICDIAATIAEDEQALPENRTTAISVCTQFNRAVSLKAVRGLAQDTSMPYALRAAAVYHIGHFGSKDEVNWLSQIATSKEFPINRAAVSAVKKLKSKHAL